jgi:hypothetical protein
MPNSKGAPRGRLATLALKGFIALCILFTAGIATLNFKPGLAIVPFAAGVPKSPYCDTWQAVDDAEVKLEQNALAGEILAGTKLVKSEDGMKLWSTPDGDYWVPDSSDTVLAALLAQQRRKIYGDANTGGVRKGDIVLDAGAHVGVYVRTALDAGAV